MSVQTQIDRINTEIENQSGLLDQAIAALQGKAGGGGGGANSGLPDGIAALASGTITPASDTSSLTITHNIGVKPDFAVLMLGKDTDPLVETSMALWSALLRRPVTLPSGTTYQALGYRYSTNSTGSLAGNSSNDSTGNTYPATETTINIPIGSYMKTGYTYRWVCGVFG